MSRAHGNAPDRPDPHKASVQRNVEPKPSQDNTAQVIESLQRAAGNVAVSGLLGASAKPGRPAGDGAPLGPELQAVAEKQLGADLGGVRVHADAAAGEYARALGATGATIGQDVYLASAASDSATAKGRQTLLHELVHVAQAPVDSFAQPRSVSRRSDPAEAEARQIDAAGLGGAASTPVHTAPPGTIHLKTAADEDEQVDQDDSQPAQPKVTAEELLNPKADDTAPDQSPKPGASGEAESVVYQITVMQPLRAALEFVESQDWDEAYAQLQMIGMRLLDYQNVYEKSDPMLYAQLMAARGWLSVLVQQLERRLGHSEWSDQAIANHMRDDVGEFERLGPLLH